MQMFREEYFDVTTDYGLPIPAMIHLRIGPGCQFQTQKSQVLFGL